MPNKHFSKLRRFGFLLLVLLLGYLPIETALAMTPQLSVVQEGNNNVRLNVSGADPYSQITLYQRQNTQLWTVVTNFGTTDQNGYFSASIGLGSNYSASQSEYYVVVNGQQSSIVTTNSGQNCYYNGCGNCSYNNNCNNCNYYNNCNNGNISFSQTNVNLNLYQSTTISIYGGSNYYISSNSNSNVVSASISGSTLNIYGSQTGSSNLTICGYQTNGCGNVYVSVNSGGNYGNQITFSQNNITLGQGQSTNVSVYSNNYNNNFYISNNTNSSIVGASITGSQLYLYGKSSGNSQITVCSNYISQCGIIYITVGYGSGDYNNLTFSESNPVVSVGQSRSINIYTNNNYYGSYYISNNSNSNVVSVSLSGSTLTLYGMNNGNSTISICQSSQYCGSLYVSVVGYGTNYNNNYNYYGYSGSNPYFTQTSLPTAYPNQYYSYQLQVSGGNTPYSFAIASGSLPPGLSLNYNGYITGTPQCGGSQSFSIQASDSLGRRATQSFNLTISGCGYNYGYYPSLNYPNYNYGYVSGISTYRNGTLIKEDGTVYIVYKNMKTGFASADAFLGLGFKWENVQNTGYTGLTRSSYTVSSQYARHPWGSWIKSGNTVYFVHELGLIPVPSYEIFINNGGEDRLVVPANSYDFSMNILNPLEYNDSRLR